MPTYDGQTLSDYNIAHGFTPAAYTVDYDTTSATLMAEVLGEQKSYVEAFVKNVGIIKVKRGGFGPTGQPSIGSLFQAKSVIKMALDHPNRQKDVYSVTAKTLPLEQWEQERTQADLHQDADFDVQVWEKGQSLAVKDRTRVEETSRIDDRFTGEASESVLDRASESSLQDASQAHRTSEAAYARSQRATLQSDQQVFEAAQSLLDRNLDTTLQDDEQSFRTTEAGYASTQKETIQNDQQAWESGESLLDRTAETNLQDAEQAHLTSEKAYERSARSTLATDQQVWEAAQSLLDRTLAVNLQDDEQTHKSLESGYARTQKTDLQNDQQSWEAAQTVLDRALDVTLQDAEKVQKSAEAVLNRAHQSTLQSTQLAWDDALQELKDDLQWDLLINDIKIQLSGVRSVDFSQANRSFRSLAPFFSYLAGKYELRNGEEVICDPIGWTDQVNSRISVGSEKRTCKLPTALTHYPSDSTRYKLTYAIPIFTENIDGTLTVVFFDGSTVYS